MTRGPNDNERTDLQMSTITVPSKADIRALRIITLRTIGELAKVHDLAAPLTVRTQITQFHNDQVGLSIALLFDNDDTQAVDLWAALLDLPPAVDHEGPHPDGRIQRWYSSRAADWRRPLWLGWHSVDVSAHYTALSDPVTGAVPAGAEGHPLGAHESGRP